MSLQSNKIKLMFRAVIQGLPQRKTWFDTSPANVAFVVKKLTLGYAAVQVLRFPLSASSHQCSTPHISFLYHRRFVISAADSVVE